MADMASLSRLDAMAQAELVERGELEAAELAVQALERIEALNPTLRAVVDVAEPPKSPDARGPLRGVPFLMKDVLPWPGLRWSMGSRLFRNNVTRRDTPIGRRLREAGLYCAGKSAMSELGLLASTETLLEGVTHNPWSLAHSPGGSSGGSAAAVAAGMVPFAHANDGGGSIRIPASACGVFGFKPSRGRTLPSGFSESDLLAITSEGCISRSVRDCARFLSLIEDPTSGHPALGFVQRRPERALRVASWTGTLSGAEPTPPVQRALDETRALFEALGHHVELVAAPSFEAELEDAMLLVAAAAVAELVQAQDRVRREPVQYHELEPFSWELVDDYRARPPGALEGARRAFEGAARTYHAALERYDVLLTPTLAREPWEVGYLSPVRSRATLWPRIRECMAYTPIQNVAGAPAMSVPLSVSERGLPIGMQLAAAPGRDDVLLELAYQLEEARPWQDRHPPYSIVGLEARA